MKQYQDGICDDINNVKDCEFDGGDCCNFEEDKIMFTFRFCTECACKDPNSLNYGQRINKVENRDELRRNVHE